MRFDMQNEHCRDVKMLNFRRDKNIRRLLNNHLETAEDNEYLNCP